MLVSGRLRQLRRALSLEDVRVPVFGRAEAFRGVGFRLPVPGRGPCLRLLYLQALAVFR